MKGSIEHLHALGPRGLGGFSCAMSAMDARAMGAMDAMSAMDAMAMDAMVMDAMDNGERSFMP